MASIRRVGGGMEPHRRPAGRRVLLPTEAELCNSLGLSEDEYWYFVEITEAYNGVRSKEYDLVPHVTNEPTAIILFVAGVALQALSYLLAPKPSVQQQKTPPQLRTADVAGRSKFAPQDSFDSIQSLAVLGSTIPLVFTRRGMRVTSQLLWSQLLSSGAGQQLKAITLFSLGPIEHAPAFEGFAIGDMLLENYTHAKMAVYFRTNGGRITEANRLAGGLPAEATDAFSVYWDGSGRYEPFFCGARNPSTQTQFGVFQPVPNGMMWRPNYELVLKPRDADNDLRRDIDRKQNKIYRGQFPLRCYINKADNQEVSYVIDAYLDPGNGYEPWGTEDFSAAQDSAKKDADDALHVGELYMVGDGLAICSHVSDNRPWEEGITKVYRFQWTEGERYAEPKTYGDLFPPYQALTIMRCAVATISNNRACHVTEIGIKSTVWKQINGFANVNSQPPQQTISKYERANGSLTLGGLTKYVTRLSFFRLEARPLGSNAAWQNISGGTVFCIKGQTPQAQYNFLRINQPFGQYEYRLVPRPGNLQWQRKRGQYVWLLGSGQLHGFNDGGFRVSFVGQIMQLNESSMSNSEWHKGTPPTDPSGRVIGVNINSKGNPVLDAWDYEQTRYKVNGSLGLLGPGSYLISYNRQQNKDYFFWDGYIGSLTGEEILVIGDYRYRRGVSKDNRLPTIPTTKGYEIIRDRRRPNLVTFSGAVNASGGRGRGLRFDVTVYQNGAASWRIIDGGQGYVNGENVFIPQANANVSIQTNAYLFIDNNLNPYDAIADYVLYDAESASHLSGPEHEVVYVNEQIQQSAPQYADLAIAGLKLNSSKEWGSFSELSAYFTRGVVADRLVAGGRGAVNLLPEIAYALLTDPQIGAGKLIGASQVNRERMALAARFCEANDFYWDGVIDQRENLRQWIFEQAGYCLLDFTILGGQFSLIPSVPYNTNGTINFAGKPEIKALFTDGNIRNLQVSFLSPEERQLFRATVIWRQEKLNGFPETRVASVRLADHIGGSDSDPEETFDMSGFCTSENHALTFARYALKTRKEVDHGLRFETTPQAAMSLAPGDYFRLVSEVTHTSRFNNGIIGPDGVIQAADTLDGNYQILYWERGTTAVQSATLIAEDGRTKQATLFSTVFTISNTTTTNRVYKVETLSYAEDGLVEVAASHVPLTDSGSLAVLNWDEGTFVTELG